MHPKNTNVLGLEFRIRRSRAGVHQYRFVQVLGIPPTPPFGWENGRAPAPPALAARVGMAIRYLATGTRQGDDDASPR